MKICNVSFRQVSRLRELQHLVLSLPRPEDDSFPLQPLWLPVHLQEQGGHGEAQELPHEGKRPLVRVSSVRTSLSGRVRAPSTTVEREVLVLRRKREKLYLYLNIYTCIYSIKRGGLTSTQREMGRYPLLHKKSLSGGLCTYRLEKNKGCKLVPVPHLCPSHFPHPTVDNKQLQPVTHGSAGVITAFFPPMRVAPDKSSASVGGTLSCGY